MLNVSIVLFNNNIDEIAVLVGVLRKNPLIKSIFLIDNSPQENNLFATLPATYIFNNKNLGYGAAHNIAIRQTMAEKTPFHLVMNADIAFEPEIFTELIDFLKKNSEIGSLMPKIVYPNGKIQYLCKLLPTPIDLLARRFLPKKWTKKRTERFEMRASGYNSLMNVPYLSGCFMLLRTAALEKVGIFDELFFMYPEDIDLTRRLHRHYKTVFYPNVQVTHCHAQGSYKNGRLLWIHLTNMAKYFDKWGWFCDRERREINEKTIKALRPPTT